MPFRARFCTSEANACVLTGAHFRARLKREWLNQKNIINSLDVFFLFHAGVSIDVMEFERTEQSSITVTSGCHFPTGTLSWSGGACDRRAWRRVTLLSKWSTADGWRKGATAGAQKDVMQCIFSVWGALITGCHCQLPEGSQQPEPLSLCTSDAEEHSEAEGWL